MRAFKQGMIDAGVEGLIPCLGKEVEEMVLENYSPFEEELVEEWGVETDGTHSLQPAIVLFAGGGQFAGVGAGDANSEVDGVDEEGDGCAINDSAEGTLLGHEAGGCRGGGPYGTG